MSIMWLCVVDKVCWVPTVRLLLTSHAIVGEPFTELIPHNEEHREWKGSQLAELLHIICEKEITLIILGTCITTLIDCSLGRVWINWPVCKVQYQNVIGPFTTYEYTIVTTILFSSILDILNGRLLLWVLMCGLNWYICLNFSLTHWHTINVSYHPSQYTAECWHHDFCKPLHTLTLKVTSMKMYV